MIIAIDGPAGAGKSTVARLIAKKLGYTYLNTGAMYRAITLKVLQDGINLEDENNITETAKKCDISFENGGEKILLNGIDVSQEIRKPEIDRGISSVVRHQKLREVMVNQQRQIGFEGNIVTEGRDVTTVVFPHADIKIYLDASIEERAKRRQSELSQKGFTLDINEVKTDTTKRDESDRSREYGPLRIDKNAIIIDTSEMSIEQVVETILNIVEKENHRP